MMTDCCKRFCPRHQYDGAARVLRGTCTLCREVPSLSRQCRQKYTAPHDIPRLPSMNSAVNSPVLAVTLHRLRSSLPSLAP